MAYICNKCGCSAMMDEGKKLRCLNCGHAQLKTASKQSSRCTHDLSAPRVPASTSSTPYDYTPEARTPADPYGRVLPEDYGRHAPQVVPPQADAAQSAGAVPPPVNHGPVENGAFTPPPFVQQPKKSHAGKIVLIIIIIFAALGIVAAIISSVSELVYESGNGDYYYDDYDDYGYDYDDYDFDDYNYGYQQDEEIPWLYADADGWVIFSEEDYTGDGTVTIPETVAGVPVTWLDHNAFYDCDEITEVFLPDCMDTINDYAFEDCDNLRVIHLPKDVDFFFVNAVSDCPALEQVIYSGTQEEWDYNVTVSTPNEELLNALVFAGD